MQPVAPEPESGYFSKKIAAKLPSIFRRNRNKPKASERHPAEAEYEMDAVPSASQAAEGVTTTQDEGMDKHVMVSDGAGESSFDEAMKRYDAEMKSFDRIKWVDIHLRHATVSDFSA